MAEPRRVAVATFGRSDFSILRPLCRMLDADARFDVGLWVGGAHFDELSGHTVDDVIAAGLPIWSEIDVGAYDHSDLGTIDMMASQMMGFAGAAKRGRGVDLVLILGDRFEAVAAGLAMVPLGVPVGHISGGSITEGAIDDVFRHCLTKIAVLHFCDLPRFARRIHHMGEAPHRIFTTGALGLDAFETAAFHPFEAFTSQFGLDGLRPGFALATLHPETVRPELNEPMAEAMIGALVEFGRDVVVTYPNADPGSDRIIEVIERAARTNSSIHCRRGFGVEWFPSAMKWAGLMVGNSSGGIIEAASFELPVVDIGDRQRGREHGPNVVHCGRDLGGILEALEYVVSTEFGPRAAAPNIYGDGRGAERVVQALATVDWHEVSGPKPFVDPDPDFAGEMMELACD